MYPSATSCEENASFSSRRASASCSPAHFTPSPALADKSAASTFLPAVAHLVVCDSRFQIAPGSVHCPFGGLHSAFSRALGLGGRVEPNDIRTQKVTFERQPDSRPRLRPARRPCALGNMVPGRSYPAGAVPSIVASKCSATALPPRPPATVNASSPRGRWTLAVSERRFAQFDLVGPGDVSTDHDRMTPWTTPTRRPRSPANYVRDNRQTIAAAAAVGNLVGVLISRH